MKIYNEKNDKNTIIEMSEYENTEDNWRKKQEEIMKKTFEQLWRLIEEIEYYWLK
jgi:hypothetical protein